MLQRIQSVYLLLAGLIPAIALFAPLAFFAKGNGSYIMMATGFMAAEIAPYSGSSQIPWGIGTFAVLTIILSLLNIFKYKNRSLQIKLCNWTVLCIVLFYVAYFAYCIIFSQNTATEFTPALCAGAPALSLIFVILAKMAVKRDEALVRAADRIR